MTLQSVDNKATFSSLCHDVVSHILDYIGDRVTISSLFQTSKEFQATALKVHRIRIRCFYLLSVISELDVQVRSFYKQNQNRLSVNSWKSAYSAYPIQIDRNILETPSYCLSSIVKKDSDMVEDNIVDKRISLELLQKYLFCFEAFPNNLLGHVFSHLKEDLIDSLSEHPDPVLDSLSLKGIQAPPSLHESESAHILDLFRRDTLIHQAKTREAGDIYLLPLSARILQSGSGDINKDVAMYDAYGTTGGYQIAVPVNIVSSRKHSWCENGVPQRIQSALPKIDEFLPVSLFMGKGKGDTVMLYFNSVSVRLRINQSRLPLSSDLDFGSLLKKKISDGINFSYPDNYYAPPLSVEQQRKLKLDVLACIEAEISRQKPIHELVLNKSFVENFKIPKKSQAHSRTDQSLNSEQLISGFASKCTLL